MHKSIHAVTVAMMLSLQIASAQHTEPTMSMDIYSDVIDHSRFDSLWRASKKFGRLITDGVWSEAFTSYQHALADADPDPYFVDARFAFWVNAYLASLMMVMQRRVGYRSTMWDSLYMQRDTFDIAHGKFTLKQLADTIGSTAQTVRSRAFLCTGSSNDPPFPSHACFAKSVRIELREQLRRLFRSEHYVLYDPAGNVLQLASTFKSWIAEMLTESGTVVDFILPWVTENLAAQLSLHKRGMQIVISDRMEQWKRAR